MPIEGCWTDGDQDGRTESFDIFFDIYAEQMRIVGSTDGHGDAHGLRRAPHTTQSSERSCARAP